MFTKILIANRGEIACRVIKTARRMGIATVAVYSDADRDAVHVEMADEAVHIGAVARRRELSRGREDHRSVHADRRARPSIPATASFRSAPPSAEALEARGIVFIGPKPRAIEAMGDKIKSKKFANAAKVSTVPGYLGVIEDAGHAEKIAGEIGYPVMIKASAGGGGKGMRIAWNAGEVRDGFDRARSEAKSSFGDDRVFIEKFIVDPRHIEIQVLGDAPWQRDLSRRARMLDPAAQPEGRGGGAVAFSRRDDAARDGRAGGRAGQGGRLPERRHGRVHRRQGSQFLFPRDEHAAAGRASGDRTRSPASIWSNR